MKKTICGRWEMIYKLKNNLHSLIALITMNAYDKIFDCFLLKV
ncbi:MAG: hypothetical protein MAG581_01851 [Deltaproteobacteria bacterium]|nr:hypothetical protein [Deltaproteobacteria bacterium]